MATTTPNYGWPVPTSTDLVKNGATAIEALGDAIDGAFVDLKGGTTGQVLAKATNTDLDYAWVTQDDSNAIQNSIVNAKGDLIGASANDVPAILSVGSNGETLVADSSTSTGLRYQSNFAAGLNKVINGDFGIWQRGTSFTPAANTNTYTADRFATNRNGTGATVTVSQQAFIPGTAPVAGYESQYFYRFAQSVAGTGGTYCIANSQRIEDVRNFAGQNFTVSFYAKADASRTLTLEPGQNFGTGGSSDVYLTSQAVTLTTSWARYSLTFACPSIAGKTLGAGSYLMLNFLTAVNTVQTIDMWGIKGEAGSVATAFQTATGTLQGELAACQRYFNRLIDGVTTQSVATLQAISTTAALGTRSFPEMRTGPTVTYTTIGDFILRSAINANLTATGSNAFNISRQSISVYLTVASGLVAGNASEAYGSGTSGRLDLSAEL